MFNLNIIWEIIKKRRGKKKIVSAQGKPFVSVCTPTYNRRQFIPQYNKMFSKSKLSKRINGMDCSR